MRSLENKTVIVTGASSGIGEATVKRLVLAGANVVLFARRQDRLEKLRNEIDPTGKQTLAVAGDITIAEDRARLVRETIERFGKVGGLVNNAGYGTRGPIECVPLDAIRKNFETNIFALVGLTQLIIPLMREAGTGRIVNVGSVAGRIARPMSSVYDATKHALEAFSEGLRGELKPFGIHLALVRPGFIITEFMQAADAASGDAMTNAGVYAPFVQDHRSGVNRLKRVAGKPDDIAKLIEHAIASPHPKNHYAGPFHAKVFLFLKWLLPDAAIEWMVRLKV